MTEKHFILATAGHVDHGKSALVKALTGTDPDRLPEEKARGITIDLGFAELNLAGPSGETFHIGIVDVPGHEDFVRNMIAGVGSIELALLVVAADDGWMPQTEEHLQILSYLRVQRIVVALTKSDLGRIDIVTAEVREQLQATAFADSQIVATSVRTGDGIGNLKRALVSEFANLCPPRDIGKPRLFVDRAFTLHGIGTVVTGTLIGGSIRRSQSIVVQPRNLPGRIRSIQSHGRDLECARPGMRTAINLPDVGLDGIGRGDVVTIADIGATHATLDVFLERSTRLKPNSGAARPIKSNNSVYIHIGTSRIAARIGLHEVGALSAGQSAIAELKLDSPVLAFVGDRFVIRDSSEQNTLAGGGVLDPEADHTNFRTAEQIQFLTERASAAHDVDVCVCSELAREGFVEAKMLLVRSRFATNEIEEALAQLEKRGKIVLADGVAANASHWANLRARAAKVVDLAHERNPERSGLDLARLRTELQIESNILFRALISELARNGFTQSENKIARESHHPSLPPQLISFAQTIRSKLATNPLDPPSRNELAKERHLQQALRFLTEKGEIVELNSDLVLLRETAAQMQNTVVEFLSTNRSATASQLRQRIGTTRRIIIPFLEYLDRAGVTRRIGDERVLANKSAAAKLTDAASAQRA